MRASSTVHPTTIPAIAAEDTDAWCCWAVEEFCTSDAELEDAGEIWAITTNPSVLKLLHVRVR